MRVAVAGVASGVRRGVEDHLEAAGHEVVVATRSHGAPLLQGCQALVVVPQQMPLTLGSRWTQHWSTHDRVHVDGVRRLVQAADEAGVRRIVHLSTSTLYAECAPGSTAEWVTERSPVCVTEATEPLAIGEMAVQDFAGHARTSVVLRLGQLVGDTPLTRWTLRAAAAGRPFGLGEPGDLAHVLHTDDVGPAAVAALCAPTGVYNVGADPVERARLVATYAAAAGRAEGHFLGAFTRRLAGARLDPLERSLRVSSELFGSVTGWRAQHARLSAGWFAAAEPALVGR